ncbi:hypothetical protein, partial [Erwinia billingiae]|uniref:hypothetical protein n=1 Tax=Erwinia billingiae TaxID=182337 RepID=UPI0032096EAE
MPPCGIQVPAESSFVLTCSIYTVSNEIETEGDIIEEGEYFEDDDDTEAGELWLGACYIAGSVCFRMISGGENLNGTTLISTLKAAQAEDDDRTSPGALSL